MSTIGFPLLLIPVAICNIIVFLMPELSLTASLVSVPLMSGTSWSVTLSDVLLSLAIFLLLLEVMKGARPGTKYFTDHFLSLLVFGGAAAEFMLLPKFGNSTFFLIMLVAMVDFLSGIALRVRRPRRVVAAAPVVEVVPAPVAPAPVAPAPAPVPRAAVVETPAPVTPPSVAPAVSPSAAVAPVIVAAPAEVSAPSVAPVVVVKPSDAETSAPESGQAAIVPPVSPQVRSPDLQPGHPTSSAPDTPAR